MREVADTGDPNALVSLGDLSISGAVGPIDAVTAIAAFKKAASQGLSNAQIRLGEISFDGIGVKMDRPKAMDYFSQAAAAGGRDRQA